jgi:hypothetical protein
MLHRKVATIAPDGEAQNLNEQKEKLEHTVATA